MASALEQHPAAPNSGNQEISELADRFAAAAVWEVLEPDEDDLLKWNLGQQLRFLRRSTN